MNNTKLVQNMKVLRINATRTYVVIMGILIGLGGMSHGIREILLGNIPTEGLLSAASGAFSLIPNYLITGIIAVILAISVIIWTIGFIDKKNGSSIFLVLSVLLFLFGGGVAHLFSIVVWGVSTRINKPLTWSKKVLPENLRKLLAKSWLVFLILGLSFVSIAILIWLTYLLPPVVIWSFLGIGILFQPLIIVSGFAHDIERQKIN